MRCGLGAVAGGGVGVAVLYVFGGPECAGDVVAGGYQVLGVFHADGLLALAGELEGGVELGGDVVGVGAGPGVVGPEDAQLRLALLGVFLFDGDVAGESVGESLTLVGRCAGLGGFQVLHPQDHLLDGLGGHLGNDGVVDAAGDVAVGVGRAGLQESNGVEHRKSSPLGMRGFAFG